MKKPSATIALVVLCVITTYAQNVKLIKKQLKFDNVGTYGIQLESPFIYINDTTIYTNPELLKSNEEPYVFKRDIFSGQSLRTDISILGTKGKFGKFLNFDFRDLRLETVKVIFEHERKTEYYTYSINNEKIKLDLLLFSVDDFTNGKGLLKYYNSSINNSKYVFVIEHLIQDKKIFTYHIFDKEFNLINTVENIYPSYIILKGVTISNSGKVMSLFQNAESYLFVNELGKEDKQKKLFFGQNYVRYTSINISYYNNDYANVFITYYGKAYRIFDTYYEDNNMINGITKELDINDSQYNFTAPKLVNTHTFENGNQLCVFMLDMNKKNQSLVNGLRIIIFSPGFKIISQYDIIRDIGSSSAAFVGNEGCYVTFYDNNMYVFYNGLKGKSVAYTFEDVAKQKNIPKTIKYLKINSSGQISDFDIEGTESLFMVSKGTERVEDKILMRIVTPSYTGGLIELDLKQ